MYIYENHLGGVYISDTLLDDQFLHCEACGDNDELLGEANTSEEARSLLSEADYRKDYIDEFIHAYFDTNDKGADSDDI